MCFCDNKTSRTTTTTMTTNTPTTTTPAALKPPGLLCASGGNLCLQDFMLLRRPQHQFNSERTCIRGEWGKNFFFRRSVFSPFTRTSPLIRFSPFSFLLVTAVPAFSYERSVRLFFRSAAASAAMVTIVTCGGYLAGARGGGGGVLIFGGRGVLVCCLP